MQGFSVADWNWPCTFCLGELNSLTWWLIHQRWVKPSVSLAETHWSPSTPSYWPDQWLMQSPGVSPVSRLSQHLRGVSARLGLTTPDSMLCFSRLIIRLCIIHLQKAVDFFYWKMCMSWISVKVFSLSSAGSILDFITQLSSRHNQAPLR